MNAFLDLINWLLLFITLSAMALMLRELSRRLGDALHTSKYYFLYDAGVAVLAVAAAIMLISYPESSLSFIARLIFFAGAALIAGTTVRYWGWIIPEIIKRSK